MTPDEVEFFQTQLKSLSALSKLDVIDDFQFLIKSAKTARLRTIADYEPGSRAREDIQLEIDLIVKILSWLEAERASIEITYRKLEGK